jgi:hypothetical protein
VALSIWLSAKTLYHPDVGGHLWAYLNWALGLRSLGCNVTWLESVMPTDPIDEIRARVTRLKNRLDRYGLADSVSVCSWTSEPLPQGLGNGCIPLECAIEADLLLNLAYGLPEQVVTRFRRSALLDYDPGLTQIWMSQGQIQIPPHDMYFTIGETVGGPGAQFPDCGLDWQYTPPCVALDLWVPQPAPCEAAFTTVSNWQMDDWVDDGHDSYANDKRTGFQPFLDLPKHTTQPLELALFLGGASEERASLEKRGWRVCDSHDVTATPWDYQRYIQNSRGEFSCAKPSYTRLQTAWISERTLCYLASGKPAVVQHTGRSRFLPDCAGLFRFRTVEEAAACLDTVAADYGRQCTLARALAEEWFSAKKVVRRLLERLVT